VNGSSDQLVKALRGTVLALVRSNSTDMSARQFAVFIACYSEAEAHTVRSLAAKLGLPKPAISRALDRLTGFDLVRRKVDPMDRGSILVQRTAVGMTFLRNVGAIMVNEYARAGEE
jgi:DNA-binding MarR family transcriptional regulator